MRKLLMNTVLVVAMVGSVTGCSSNEVATQPQAPNKIVEVIPNDNVGNGQHYTYEITEINGNEINGLPLDKASYGNRGILLYTSEVGFDVQIGDAISVVWGEYEDEFKSIEKAVKAEDGSYVPESFYK